MKKLIFCFDGTWNRIDSPSPTNVARIAQAISRVDRHDHAQLIHYDEGVGTNSKWLKMPAGMFGWGLKDNIAEAYHFLVLNYEPGDDIYVFGFSRGAFSARSFVGMVRNCGIVSRRALHQIGAAKNLYTSRKEDTRPDSDAARQFRFEHCRELCLPGDRQWRKDQYPNEDNEAPTDLNIRYVGIWDTVGALGVPKHLNLFSRFRRKYRFHDTRLSSTVKRARHAVAIDERRATFEPTLWSNLDVLNAAEPEAKRYQQMLFPGNHGSVGGGGLVTGLSDAALEWVMRGAMKEELRFDVDEHSPLFELLPDHRAALFNVKDKYKNSFGDLLEAAGRLADRDFSNMETPEFHPLVIRRFHSNPADLPEKQPYRPAPLKQWYPLLRDSPVAADIQVDEAALEKKGYGTIGRYVHPTACAVMRCNAAIHLALLPKRKWQGRRMLQSCICITAALEYYSRLMNFMHG